MASDPEFAQYKDDPVFWQRLNENLSQEPSYNQGLPPAGSYQPQEPLSFPPHFSTWGNQGLVPNFYSQDPIALGRMLAEYGGDFDPGPRY